MSPQLTHLRAHTQRLPEAIAHLSALASLGAGGSHGIQVESLEVIAACTQLTLVCSSDREAAGELALRECLGSLRQLRKLCLKSCYFRSVQPIPWLECLPCVGQLTHLDLPASVVTSNVDTLRCATGLHSLALTNQTRKDLTPCLLRELLTMAASHALAHALVA